MSKPRKPSRQVRFKELKCLRPVVPDMGHGYSPNKGRVSKLKGRKKVVEPVRIDGVTGPNMTPEQVRRLAAALPVGTVSNVFRVAAEVLGVPLAGDGVFERLERDADLFRCALCSRWRRGSQGNKYGKGADAVFGCRPCPEYADGDE